MAELKFLNDNFSYFMIDDNNLVANQDFDELKHLIQNDYFSSRIVEILFKITIIDNNLFNTQDWIELDAEMLHFLNLRLKTDKLKNKSILEFFDEHHMNDSEGLQIDLIPEIFYLLVNSKKFKKKEANQFNCIEPRVFNYLYDNFEQLISQIQNIDNYNPNLFQILTDEGGTECEEEDEDEEDEEYW